MPWLNIIFALIFKHNSRNFRALAYNEFKYSLGAPFDSPPPSYGGLAQGPHLMHYI